jgi:16S rRNA processing protein RimM
LKTKTGSDPVVIGRVGSPSGLRGEFRVTLYAQDSDNLKEGKVLLLKHAKEEISAKIERARYQKDRPVIKLEGFDDRTSVEPLRNMEISIDPSDLEELPEGEHYVRNLIGCRVIDIAGGGSKEIGTLQDVIQNTAQSVLDVKTPEGRSVLIPAVDAFLRKIDEEEGLIEVELIPGFLD